MRSSLATLALTFSLLATVPAAAVEIAVSYDAATHAGRSTGGSWWCCRPTTPRSRGSR